MRNLDPVVLPDELGEHSRWTALVGSANCFKSKTQIFLRRSGSGILRLPDSKH